MRLGTLKKSKWIEFEVLGEYSFCGYHHQALIPVRTQKELDVVWEKFKANSPEPSDPPVVDFESDMLIFACRGAFPTRGYGTSVRHLVEAKDRIGNTFLWVVVFNANPRGGVEQTFTQPWCLVKTAMTKRPIRGFFVGQ